jgi:hypothetical protein
MEILINIGPPAIVVCVKIGSSEANSPYSVGGREDLAYKYDSRYDVKKFEQCGLLTGFGVISTHSDPGCLLSSGVFQPLIVAQVLCLWMDSSIQDSR